MSRSDTDLRKGEGRAVHSMVTRWVGAGLLTQEQAQAIEAFEAGPAAPPRRIPLVTEALGYLGAALALAAAVAFLGQVWDEITRSAQLAILAAAAAALWFGGWLLRRAEDPAFGRLMSVLWFLSVGVAAGFFFVLGPEDDVERAWLVAGIGATVFGGALWAARKAALQLLVAFAGLATAALAGLAVSMRGGIEWQAGILIWALGLLLVLAGWAGLVRPTSAAYAIGSAAAVIGPFIGPQGWTQFVGLATGAALMALSVGVRRTVLLGFGAFAVFVYLLRITLQYLGEAIGAPLALLVAGVALLAVALVTARLRRLTAPGGAGLPAGG
jgi:hypothetical protein